MSNIDTSVHGKSTRHDTFWLILLGCLAFGGTKGRFIAGLSLFDFLLVYLFIKSLKRLSIHRVSVYFLGIAIYGVLVSLLNKFAIHHPYNYFIAEFRFYLYVPMIFQVIHALEFRADKINRYLTVLIIVYIVVFLFFMDYGGFLFNVFNEERSKHAFDFLGRIKGPPVIMLSMLYFISLNYKPKLYNTLLYLLLVTIVYIKTGERTVLLVNLLPVLWLVYEKRSIWMLAALPVAASFIPLYINSIQLKRFQNILHPLKDPAVRYRIENYRVLLMEKMPEHPHTFLTGFGIGSDYDAHVSRFFNRSYFLDNTYLMLLYKLGIIIALIYILLVYSRILHLRLSQQIYLAIFITIPALPMYHWILQPAYFISYFLAIKFLTRENRTRLHTS